MNLDANKRITYIAGPAIRYNHLNLPERVTFSNGKSVKYQYDAAGIKLRKETKEGNNITITDYVSGKHYVNDTLSFFPHREGRVVNNAGTFNYEYNLTDHLGNVRVSLDDGGNVVQRDDYYPFGMTFQSYKSDLENNYQYNQGIGDKTFDTERQVELELDMTKLRMYDYVLGRFTSIDPLADAVGQEVYTPYHYTGNNPIRFSDPYGDCHTCMWYFAKAAVHTWWNSNVSGPVQRLANGNSSGIPREVSVGSTTRSQLQTYGKLRDQTTLTNSAVDATETVAEGVNSIPGVDVVGDPLLAGYFALKGDEASSASYAAGIFVPFVAGGVIKYSIKDFWVPISGKIADSFFTARGISNFDEFYKATARLDVGERISEYKAAATRIADSNNWVKNSKLTKKNNRDIFTDADGNHFALDTQHGTFEVLNSKGRHQGEIDFNGWKTKDADKSGGHDIILK